MDELYNELIMDHNRNPRNMGHLDKPTHTGDAMNPLCGDVVHLEAVVENGTIQDLKFTGKGCALSMASASLLTQELKGKKLDEVKKISNAVIKVATEADAPKVDPPKLNALAGVREYPMRVKCVTMCWHTLLEALK